MLTVSELVLITFVAVITAVIARLFLNGPYCPAVSPPATPPDSLSLLFDDGVLHHASSAALKKFAFAPGVHVWDDLRDGLLLRFPDFPERPGAGATGSINLRSSQENDHSDIEVNWRDGLCWVHLNEPTDGETATMPKSRKIDPLLRCVKTMPHPAWEVDENDHIIWKNDAFTKLTNRLNMTRARNPLALDDTKEIQRCSAVNATGEQEWFEVVANSDEGCQIYHATPITALVKAEEAQRTFIQTLAKTFAHLPIGLAIFDKRSQLAIFNPALVDLSGLHASFLATQPTMIGFFDALRENRRMPEPKNYRSWRQDITDVITAASGEQYQDTWTLEDGRTYAIQGRPHPDGATAFLIEDISPEITLARSYRAEIEQFEALLDIVEDALVVFSPSGVLTFCNRAYRKLWDQDPEVAFADITIHDAVKVWKSKAQVGTNWAELIHATTTVGARFDKTYDLYLLQGEKLNCTLSPSAANATMIRFSQTPVSVNITVPTSV